MKQPVFERRHLRLLSVLIAVGTNLGCLDDCASNSPSGSVDDLVVEGLETGAIEVYVGEPFELEAKVIEADGTPATDYSWRWTIESYGHSEDATRAEPNIERMVLTSDVADQIYVNAEVGRSDGDTMRWRTIRGPTLLGWGGTPDQIFVSDESVTLAVGERRPIVVLGVAKRPKINLTAEETGVGHHPTTLVSSDTDVVTVTPGGLLEGHAAGSATITATYESLTRTVEVTVDPDLAMAPPLVGNPRLEEFTPGQFPGNGLVDDSGFPVFDSSLAVVPDRDDRFLRLSMLARWTGTGTGYEMYQRPSEARGNIDIKMARGADGLLWLAYHNLRAPPFDEFVIAHRPIDGGPDDWTHRELDLGSLIGSELVDFVATPKFGLRARPDGGVWIVVGGGGEWALPDGEGEESLDTFALLNVTPTEMSGEVVLVTNLPDRPLGTGTYDLLIRQSNDPARPDILGLPIGEPPTLLSWDAQRQQWLPGSLISPFYAPPSTSLEFNSLVQAIDPGDPSTESRIIMTMVADPSPGDDDGKGLAIVLPSDPATEEPDAIFPYDWWFKRGYAALHGDELFFVTDSGTPIWHWLMADVPDVDAERAIQRFTTVNQFGRAPRSSGFENTSADSFRGWAFGSGVFYMAGGGVELSRYAHPLLANDAEGVEGRYLGLGLRTRPVAFADGRLAWSVNRTGPSTTNRSVAVMDDVDAPTRLAEIDFPGLVDLRAVGNDLFALVEGRGVFESFDEGETWVFAGNMEDLPVNPWAMVDGSGNRHTIEFDGGTDEFIWQWYAPEADVPTQTKRLAGPHPSPGCSAGNGDILRNGFELGHTLVTSGGSIIRCTRTRANQFEYLMLEYLIAGPDDDTWSSLSLGLINPGGSVGNTALTTNPWSMQVVELADERVIFGFTGLDPRTKQTRAVLVELQADGTLSAPHVMRPEGGYGQEFRSMEPLPDGGLLVVLRDHGLPDTGVSVPSLAIYGVSQVLGFDLIVRVDQLSPDQELLDAWIEAGLERP